RGRQVQRAVGVVILEDGAGDRGHGSVFEQCQRKFGELAEDARQGLPRASMLSGGLRNHQGTSVSIARDGVGEFSLSSRLGSKDDLSKVATEPAIAPRSPPGGSLGGRDFQQGVIIRIYAQL